MRNMIDKVRTPHGRTNALRQAVTGGVWALISILPTLI